MINLKLYLITLDPEDKNGIVKLKEVGFYSPRNKDVYSLLSLEYENLNVSMKRYIWMLYLKRVDTVFFEKGKLT